eukprot:9697903-Alexandrium_andersonii.AAC.1
MGLHSHTCPGQTRRRRDVVERALQKEWSHYGLMVGNQPAGTSYRRIPDLVVVSPVHPGAIYVECDVPHIQAPTNRVPRGLDDGPAALRRVYENNMDK